MENLNNRTQELIDRSENSFLSIQNLEKIYPNGAKAVYNFNLDIKKNEFIVIVGPSGCGKSTTLRMVAGLEDISEGDLYLNNELINYLPSKDRKMAIVFQSYALYPQMSVYENIAFPLSINKYPYPVVHNELKAANEILNILNQDKYEEVIKLYVSRSNISKKGKLPLNEMLATRLKITLVASNLLINLLKQIQINEIEEALNKKADNVKRLKEHLIASIEDINSHIASKGEKYNENYELLDNEDKVVIEYRKMTNFEIKCKVFETAEILDLGDYLDRLPKELSGGQMQRVALGRAIVKNVPLFLMDEPLSNLDAKLRLVMRSEIVKIHNRIGATTIYVTHDQTEAMTMASRIVVMSRGFIQQIGTPEEIYNDPSNLFVAKFVGSPSINIFDLKYKDGVMSFPGDKTIKMNKKFVTSYKEFYEKTLHEFETHGAEWNEKSTEYILKIISALSDDKKVMNQKKKKKSVLSKLTDLFKRKNVDAEDIRLEVGIFESKFEQIRNVLNEESTVLLAVRPEKMVVRLDDGKKLKAGEFKVTVTVSELLGAEYYVHFDFNNHDMVAKLNTANKIKPGDELIISFDMDDVLFFDPITGGRIL